MIEVRNYDDVYPAIEELQCIQLRAGTISEMEGGKLSAREGNPYDESRACLSNSGGGKWRKSRSSWSVLVVATVALLALGVAGCGSSATATSVPKGVVGSSTTATSVMEGVAGSAPWRMSGHDSEHTSRSPAVGSRSGALKWTYKTDGLIAASPVIDSDGTTFIVSRGDNPGTGTLYAFRPDGTLKWANKGEFASSPTLGPDGTIYVADSQGRLLALGRDGRPKWSDAGDDISSSLVVMSDGTIYGAGFNLVAFNSKGTLKWSYKPSRETTNGEITSLLAVAPDGTIYAEANPLLLAINPNGSLKWSHRLEGEDSSIRTLAIASDGTIYMGEDNGKLYAIDSSGHLNWTFAARNVNVAAAIGRDGTIYVAGDKLYALTPSGKVKWSYVTGQGDEAGAEQPCIDANGTTYFLTPEPHHNLIALNSDGALKWSHKMQDYTEYTSPSIGPDGGLYVGSMDGGLYVFSK